MVDFKILGSGCAKCLKLAANAEAAAKELGLVLHRRQDHRPQPDHRCRRDDDAGADDRRQGQVIGQGADAGADQGAAGLAANSRRGSRGRSAEGASGCKFQRAARVRCDPAVETHGVGQ